MPKFLEDILRRGAVKKGFKGKRADKYVFGAMNNMGAMKGNQPTAKGERMQAKHDRKVGNQHRTSESHMYNFRDHLGKPGRRKKR